ncbi:unnamed protein product [Brassica rapa subsp. trilocularis]
MCNSFSFRRCSTLIQAFMLFPPLLLLSPKIHRGKVTVIIVTVIIVSIR